MIWQENTVLSQSNLNLYDLYNTFGCGGAKGGAKEGFISYSYCMKSSYPICLTFCVQVPIGLIVHMTGLIFRNCCIYQAVKL